MAKFTEEQKNFIIRSFARNRCPAYVRREFFKVFKIHGGRKKSHYPGKDFVRVKEHFEKTESLKKTPPNLPKNVLKRAELCLTNNGGQFQHLL